MVQLNCENCHTTGGTDPDLTYADARYRAASVVYKEGDVVLEIDRDTPKRARPITGRELMAPPKFANACAACHLLTFDKRFDDGAPHDKPEVIHAYLVERFSEYIGAWRGTL
jgi:hypothetical protein